MLMEQCKNMGEIQAKLNYQCSSNLKSMPPNSPSFRRLTTRREGKVGGGGGGGGSRSAQWFQSNRILLWLLMITLWAYVAFFVQSRWENGDKEDEFLGFGSRSIDTNPDSQQNQHQDLIVDERIIMSFDDEIVENKLGVGETMHVASLSKKENLDQSVPKTSSKRKIRRRSKRKRKSRGEGIGIEEQDPEIPKTNSTYGFLVGPFGSIEDRILQWNPEKHYFGGCNRKGEFARLVHSKRFVLIFHELSMTGAPLSMMELGTELLNCGGAAVSAVVLSKKGGLMQELTRRRIKVLEDKAQLSFKAARNADLVIAGSAVCASWIEQYIDHFPDAASQVAWWIMENRREYFDRSKQVLHRVNMLAFLSKSQSKQWQKWCEEERVKLRSQPAIIPLSVNDELAFVAGIASMPNTPSFSAEKMAERRKLLRDSVRREMGLNDNDMLVITLSSINTGKGQFLLLKSASSIVEHEPSLQDDNKEMRSSSDIGDYLSSLARTHHIGRLLLLLRKNSSVAFNDISSTSMNRLHEHTILSNKNASREQSLKILIGSVGSKSNKVDYVKGILHFLSQHSNLSKSVLWTPATTRVASLYSAADVYVINSQGLGETFGRVTIEAMAFGLPVLGTNAGGTQEIVEHNVTGLLHPIGRPGIRFLAQNLRFLLENRPARERMGRNGRRKVQRMYLKHHMYTKIVEVLVRCMRRTK
ncbi:uncharacterized protein LOC107464012 [Arachis duranensis]|uniref:Uncharacterized protein LOC107464012 n=1 Tax=Arachis duranensis TaxID=130453 RepID=A0A6P5MY53_ARADU|nr:uncharacterized protein LOC107464012 [Arachis duranensis]